MTHGYIPFEPRPPMLVIHPGPVAKVFIDGCEVAAVPLSQGAALYIAAQLLTAVSVRLPAQTNTPNENLSPAVHIARRDAERAAAAEDDGA